MSAVTLILVCHPNDFRTLGIRKGGIQKLSIKPCAEGTVFPRDCLTIFIEWQIFKRFFREKKQAVMIFRENNPCDGLGSVGRIIILLKRPEDIFVADFIIRSIIHRFRNRRQFGFHFVAYFCVYRIFGFFYTIGTLFIPASTITCVTGRAGEAFRFFAACAKAKKNRQNNQKQNNSLHLA